MPRTTTVNGRTQSVNGRTVGGTDIPDFVDYYVPYDEGSGTDVSPQKGSTTITLNNSGTWESDPDFVGGTAPEYDGANDYAVTDSTLPLAGSTFSVCQWVADASIAGSNERIISGTDDSDPGARGNGWTLFINSYDPGADEAEYRLGSWVDGGSSFDEISITTVSPTPEFEDQLFVVSGNGDDLRLRIFDRDKNKLADNSDFANRSQPGDVYLTYAAKDGEYFEATEDATFASFSAVFSDSEIGDIIDYSIDQ